jgi:hypothetical protein
MRRTWVEVAGGRIRTSLSVRRIDGVAEGKGGACMLLHSSFFVVDHHTPELYGRDSRIWHEIRVKAIMSLYKHYVEHCPFCGIFDIHGISDVVSTAVFR